MQEGNTIYLGIKANSIPIYPEYQRSNEVLMEKMNASIDILQASVHFFLG